MQFFFPDTKSTHSRFMFAVMDVRILLIVAVVTSIVCVILILLLCCWCYKRLCDSDSGEDETDRYTKLGNEVIYYKHFTIALTGVEITKFSYLSFGQVPK